MTSTSSTTGSHRGEKPAEREITPNGSFHPEMDGYHVVPAEELAPASHRTSIFLSRPLTCPAVAMTRSARAAQASGEPSALAGPDRGVWCVTDAGDWVLATKYGVKPAPASGLTTKARIVHALIDREMDYAGWDREHRRFNVQSTSTPAVDRHRITAQLAWWAWHHLYPSEPFPFDALVYTPDRQAESKAA